RDSIYTIPESMRQSGLDREVLSLLDSHDRVQQGNEDDAREKWRVYVNKLNSKRKYPIKLGITGKYAALRDAYASIDKSLEHSASHLSVELDIHRIDTTQGTIEEITAQLKGLDAIIVPGGFGVRGTEGKIACVNYARTQMVPYLGIC